MTARWNEEEFEINEVRLAEDGSGLAIVQGYTSPRSTTPDVQVVLVSWDEVHHFLSDVSRQAIRHAGAHRGTKN